MKRRPSSRILERPKERKRVSPSPSFKGLLPASPASSRLKRRNRHKNTKAELLLFDALSKLGLHFLKHANFLPGKPDVVFQLSRIVVFCDGDFWHGRHWRILRKRLSLGANPHYWLAKIAANRTRDQKNRNRLTRMGWHCVRLWETDIKRDPQASAAYVRN